MLRSGSSSRVEFRQRLDSWLEDHIKRNYRDESICRVRFCLSASIGRDTIKCDQPSNHILSSPGVHDEETNLFDSPASGVNNNNNNHSSSRGACDNQSSHGSSLFDSSNDGSQQQRRISLSETKNHVHNSPSRQSIDDLLSDEDDPCNSKKSHTASASASAPASTPTPAVPDQEDDDADTVQYSPNSTPREEQDDDASTVPYNPTSPSTHNDDDEVGNVPYNPIDSTTSNHDQPAAPVLPTKTSTPPTTSLFDSFDDDDLFDDDDTNDININHQQQQDNHIQGIACSPNSGSLNLSDLDEAEEGVHSPRKKLSQQPLQRFFSVTTNNSPLSPSSLSFIPALNNPGECCWMDICVCGKSKRDNSSFFFL